MVTSVSVATFVGTRHNNMLELLLQKSVTVIKTALRNAAATS